MVSLLCRDGHVAGALELERLWDDLAGQVPFSLLCSYPEELMRQPSLIETFADICDLHPRVLGGPAVPAGAAASRRFPLAAQAPGHARRFVAAALRSWGRPDLADDGALSQRAVYIADLPTRDLAAELAGLPGGAAALDRGAVVVLPSADVHEPPAPVNVEARLGAYAQVVDRAIADGFLGARVAADITPLVADPGWRAVHLGWEQAADRYMTEQPLASACLYDARRVSGIVNAGAGPHRRCPGALRRRTGA